MPRRRPSPAFVLAFLALLVSLSGVGYAAIPAKDGDVHLCYSKTTREVTVVDMQNDNFDCEKSWVGFSFDTKPTRLVSPNGKFRVEATDAGARMTGPDSEVSVGAGTVSVKGTKGIEVRSQSVVDVAGRNDVTIGSDKNVRVRAGDGLGLTAV